MYIRNIPPFPVQDLLAVQGGKQACLKEKVIEPGPGLQ